MEKLNGVLKIKEQYQRLSTRISQLERHMAMKKGKIQPYLWVFLRYLVREKRILLYEYFSSVIKP
jgi:hypothetical protein